MDNLDRLWQERLDQISGVNLKPEPEPEPTVECCPDCSGPVQDSYDGYYCTDDTCEWGR